MKQTQLENKISEMLLNTLILRAKGVLSDYQVVIAARVIAKEILEDAKPKKKAKR